MHIDESWFQYLARVLIALATAIQGERELLIPFPFSLFPFPAKRWQDLPLSIVFEVSSSISSLAFQFAGVEQPPDGHDTFYIEVLTRCSC